MITNWLAGLLVLCLGFSGAQAQSSQSRQQKQGVEETADYYKKWLEEDVVYIITDEEKAVFNSLSTPLEKERFIEQFWTRRDDDLSTQENEFKLEHYRRIAYANEHFASGYPGWVTDRGRIYITFGPPDEIQSHSSGETYDRPLYEGGGTTQTYPYQLWRYRHVEGIGSDIELEFVDKTHSGEFRLALLADEKDALVNVGISGPTLLEQLGLSNKTERGTTSQELGFAREKDSPFIRYETYSKLLSPREIRYTDLREVVEVDTQFVDLPLVTRTDYIDLDEHRVLALVTIQVDNRYLDFRPGDRGVYAARLAIYGVVTSLGKRVIAEFDDDLESLRAGSLTEAMGQRSLYQKMLPLERKTRYKLSMVVKDLNSEKIGMAQTVIDPPAYRPDKLATSGLILSESIRRVPIDAPRDEMFVIGDLKVRPNLSGEFLKSDPLGVYVQLYNAQIDSATFTPALAVAYRIMRGEEILFEVVDREGESTQFQSGARVVLVRRFKLQKLEPGQYSVQVRIEDRISGEHLTIQDDFRVVTAR